MLALLNKLANFSFPFENKGTAFWNPTPKIEDVTPAITESLAIPNTLSSSEAPAPYTKPAPKVALAACVVGFAPVTAVFPAFIWAALFNSFKSFNFEGSLNWFPGLNTPPAISYDSASIGLLVLNSFILALSSSLYKAYKSATELFPLFPAAVAFIAPKAPIISSPKPQVCPWKVSLALSSKSEVHSGGTGLSIGSNFSSPVICVRAKKSSSFNPTDSAQSPIDIADDKSGASSFSFSHHLYANSAFVKSEKGTPLLVFPPILFFTS